MNQLLQQQTQRAIQRQKEFIQYQKNFKAIPKKNDGQKKIK